MACCVHGDAGEDGGRVDVLHIRDRQLGVMGEFDKEAAREMIAVMRDDVNDMLHAADMLGRVARDMLDNAERNL